MFNIPKNEGVVLLISSGADSLLLLKMALSNNNVVYPLFIDCGYPWEKAEYHWLSKILEYYQTDHRLQKLSTVHINQKEIEENNWIHQGVIPQLQKGTLTNTIIGRNALLLSYSYIYAKNLGVNNVILGLTKHADSYADAQIKFLEGFTEAINLGLSSNIRLFCPLPIADIDEIRKFIKDNDIPWHFSFSCYNPSSDFKKCDNCCKCSGKIIKYANWNING